MDTFVWQRSYNLHNVSKIVKPIPNTDDLEVYLVEDALTLWGQTKTNAFRYKGNVPSPHNPRRRIKSLPYDISITTFRDILGQFNFQNFDSSSFWLQNLSNAADTGRSRTNTDTTFYVARKVLLDFRET